MSRPKRKELWIGKQVQVCGYPVNPKNNLICLLPATMIHDRHASLALTEEDPPDIIIVFHDNRGDLQWREAKG